MSFTFGPVQTKFLEALESGEYVQIRHSLAKDGGFCALGLANYVCELGESERNIFIQNTYDKLGLFSGVGSCKLTTESLFMKVCGHSAPSIASMNDSIGMSFKEIAAHLRKYPEWYFTHAV